MRVLFLTQIVPYPPDAGPKVKTWHVLRHLADAGHQIILVTYVRPEEDQFIPKLREVCTEVYGIPLKRSRLRDFAFMAISLFKNVPFLVERDNLPAMQEKVEELLAAGKVDIVHADQFTMAQFALYPQSCQIRKIFDAHNATWKIVERSVSQYPFWLRFVLKREAVLMRAYERRVIQEYDHTFTVTSVDHDFLLSLFTQEQQPSINRKITPIPISVDCDAIHPLPRPSGSKNIVTLGTMHYPPNADGIRWFIKEVFPLVLKDQPDAHLTVIGKNPPEDFILEANRNPASITVTGYVPDLVPHLSSAALIVVPVRSGGGMRVRILEAFAYGLPTVTTTTGLEGIDASISEDVLVKDTPSEFAAAVLQILHDPDLQKRLSVNGRKLAEEKYHWKSALTPIDKIYASYNNGS